MTNIDTPLTEVAALLPPEAAKVLTMFPWPVQESVLRQVRTVIWSLERQKHTLDPIEFAAVIGIFVGCVTPLTDALYRAGGGAP